MANPFGDASITHRVPARIEIFVAAYRVGW
jgi:hypothetical protein